MQEFTCQILVNLILPPEVVFEKAIALGRRFGHDEDWEPESLNHAIAEIILYSDAPIEQGVEILETA